MNVPSSIAFLSASLLALAMAGCKPKIAAPVPYNVRVAEAQPMVAASAQGPSFLGVIRGETETALSFKVNGQIERIGPEGESEDWKQGVAVKTGAVLARLDRSNFINAVSAARARADLARANFMRNSDLYGAGNLSKSEFDGSRAQKEMAEADLAQAEQYLRDATLRAPYDGVVITRLAKSGEFAAAGRPVMMIGDFRTVSLEVGVPDSILSHMAVGDSHSVLVSAYEGVTFEGRVSEAGIAADPSSRLFKVVLKIDNHEGRLKSGMTASVRFASKTADASGGLLVPLSALVATPSGEPAVFVVDAENRARLRRVKTTDILRSSITVTDGIGAGDKIVVLGAGQLTEGAPVRILTSNN